MAKKSTNTQGNPWHDESTGEFTSQNGGGSSSDNEESQAMHLMGLKSDSTGDDKEAVSGKAIKDEGRVVLPEGAKKISSNQDMSYIKQAYQQMLRNKGYKDRGLELGKDLKECEQIGSNILGSGIVAYSTGLNLNYANQLNQALFDIKNDYPQLLESLARFGTGAATEKEVEQIKQNANKRCNELAKSLNVQLANVESKDWVSKYIEQTLGDGVMSYARGLLGMTERGYTHTLGYYRFTPIRTDETDELAKQRKEQIQNAGLSSAGKTQAYTGLALVGLTAIQFNPTYFGKSDFVEGKGYVGGGFHYEEGKGSAYSTGAHELGHFVDVALSNNFMNTEELNERMRLAKNILANEKASEYARSDYLETAAEAFADYYSNGNNALPENIEYVRFMNKMYHKYFDDGGVKGAKPGDPGEKAPVPLAQ